MLIQYLPAGSFAQIWADMCSYYLYDHQNSLTKDTKIKEKFQYVINYSKNNVLIFASLTPYRIVHFWVLGCKFQKYFSDRKTVPLDRTFFLDIGIFKQYLKPKPVILEEFLGGHGKKVIKEVSKCKKIEYCGAN